MSSNKLWFEKYIQISPKNEIYNERKKYEQLFFEILEKKKKKAIKKIKKENLEEDEKKEKSNVKKDTNISKLLTLLKSYINTKTDDLKTSSLVIKKKLTQFGNIITTDILTPFIQSLTTYEKQKLIFELENIEEEPKNIYLVILKEILLKKLSNKNRIYLSKLTNILNLITKIPKGIITLYNLNFFLVSLTNREVKKLLHEQLQYILSEQNNNLEQLIEHYNQIDDSSKPENEKIYKRKTIVVSSKILPFSEFSFGLTEFQLKKKLENFLDTKSNDLNVLIKKYIELEKNEFKIVNKKRSEEKKKSQTFNKYLQLSQNEISINNIRKASLDILKYYIREEKRTVSVIELEKQETNEYIDNDFLISNIFNQEDDLNDKIIKDFFEKHVDKNSVDSFVKERLKPVPILLSHFYEKIPQTKNIITTTKPYSIFWLENELFQKFEKNEYMKRIIWIKLLFSDFEWFKTRLNFKPHILIQLIEKDILFTIPELIFDISGIGIFEFEKYIESFAIDYFNKVLQNFTSKSKTIEKRYTKYMKNVPPSIIFKFVYQKLYQFEEDNLEYGYGVFENDIMIISTRIVILQIIVEKENVWYLTNDNELFKNDQIVEKDVINFFPTNKIQYSSGSIIVENQNIGNFGLCQFTRYGFYSLDDLIFFSYEGLELYRVENFYIFDLDFYILENGNIYIIKENEKFLISSQTLIKSFYIDSVVYFLIPEQTQYYFDNNNLYIENLSSSNRFLIVNSNDDVYANSIEHISNNGLFGNNIKLPFKKIHRKNTLFRNNFYSLKE